MAWQHKSHRTEVKFGGACALVWLASVEVSQCRLVLRSVAPWNPRWREYAGSGFEFAKRSGLELDVVLNPRDWLLALAERCALVWHANVKVSRCRLVLRSVAPWNLTWREYAGSGFRFAKRSALELDLVLNCGDWLLDLAERCALEFNAALN